jgi:arylsulfatase A-like enzyme
VEAASELTGPEAPAIGADWVRPALSGDPWPVDWRQRLAEGGVKPQDWGRPGLEAIRTQRYLYVEYDNNERELYDLEEDPYELHNRYEDADQDVLRRLEDRLDALRGCAGAACRAAENGHRRGGGVGQRKAREGVIRSPAKPLLGSVWDGATISSTGDRDREGTA